MTIKDVLNTVVQPHWQFVQRSPKMEDKVRKISCSSSDAPSPILLRRRLSAPETVMRKHVLAQQRSESQDSDASQASGTKSHQWRYESSIGSDPNLNRKRDYGLMRRSTLLRRLWSNPRAASDKSDWQGSFNRLSSGRSNHSLSSNQSSPEHKIYSRRTEEYRVSPKHTPSPSRRKFSCLPDSNSNRIVRGTDDMANYNSTGTSFEQPDSAYTNSRSSLTQTSNSRSVSSDIRKVIMGSSDASNENANILDANANATGIKNSETQTTDTTNVNVISNVQLSKATLDVIYSHVMRDVQNNVPSVINVSAPFQDSINVQHVPSFYLKRKGDIVNCKQNQILKYMISNVSAGSAYSKPAEVPQVVVPRYSALPRTASMEVNASSADSTDRESDTVSLVDSLEDPSSPRLDSNHHTRYDDKPVRGDISLLLPNESTKKKVSKTSAFFIPIESTSKPLSKPVAEHLPDKVREKLARRQAKREQKMQEARTKLSPTQGCVSSAESGDQVHVVVDHTAEYISGETRAGKQKKNSLPKIQTIRKVKIDSKEERPKRRTDATGPRGKSQWSSKYKQKSPEKLSPLYTSKNEYFCDQSPGKIYHKTEMTNSNKRIEILEIMECIDVTPEKLSNQHTKGRSRIPVFVHHRKLPKIPSTSRHDKPTFLDFNAIRIDDPKIDQLIANILIDSLHNDAHEEQEKAKIVDKPSTSRPSKYQQRFEVIPEEFQQSSIEHSNNNVECEKEVKENDNNNPDVKTQHEAYKGKAALVLERDENLATLPQGWITFYMLQNSQGTPENTSDEGNKKLSKETKQEEPHKDENKTEEALPKEEEAVTKENESVDTTDRISSPSDFSQDGSSFVQQSKMSRNKRQLHLRKSRIRRIDEQTSDKHGWSVTVSGTSANGDFTPNLEMRLKFPRVNQANLAASDSGLGDENSYRNFPPPKHGDSPNGNDLDDERRCRLPNIHRDKPPIKYKRCDTTGTSRTEPRQTKTSSRRLSLNRPRQLPLIAPSRAENDVDFHSEERHIQEILRRFPHLLSVTGNAICPERKPRVYTMTERDLVRTVYSNQQ